MATDKTAIWSFGESRLWYSPTSGVDAAWSFGESLLLDEVLAFGMVTPVWSWGESQLLYSPTSELDTVWSLGESLLLDEWVAPAGGTVIPIMMYHYMHH